MSQHFIVTNTFEHQIDCFCPGGEHAEIFVLQKTDFIELKNERKFVMDRWYSLVVINHQWYFYMALEDLDQYLLKGYLYSMLDIELKINYLHFQVNLSLDNGNEVLFLESATRLNEANDLKDYLENNIRHTEIKSYYM